MRNRDPKYIDVPNICFSHTSKDDSREPKYKKQRMQRGFDDSETWSLDVTFAEFMLPRLERFKEIVVQVNKPDTKFDRDVNDVIEALKLIIRNNGTRFFSDAEEKQVQKGLKTLSRLFLSLWW